VDEVAVRGRWIDGISKEVAATSARVKSEFSILSASSLALGAVGVTLAGAFQFLSTTMREAAKAGIEQERADRALENALKSTNQFTNERIKGLKEYAGTLQRVTTFEDEQIQQAQAMAIALGVSADRIVKMTDAAAVLAVTLGMDLSSAMRVLVKGEIGQFEGALTRLIGPITSVSDAIDKLAAKRGTIVDLGLGPAERDLRNIKVDINELQESLGGAGVAFENFGARGHRAILQMIESALQLGDIIKDLGQLPVVAGVGPGGRPIVLPGQDPAAAASNLARDVNLDTWREGRKPAASPDQITDPNVLSGLTLDISKIDPDKSRAKLDKWKTEQKKIAEDQAKLLEDITADRDKWVEEFIRLMNFTPNAAYRKFEDIPVGFQEEFGRKKGFDDSKKEDALKNAEDFIGGFYDAIPVIDATGEAIDEMTAVIGEAGKWSEEYAKQKKKESEATKYASGVAEALADSFEENFNDILDQHEGFFENLAQIIGDGLSKIIEDALDKLGAKAGEDVLGFFLGIISGGGGGGSAGGTAIPGGGVWESSVTPPMTVSVAAASNRDALDISRLIESIKDLEFPEPPMATEPSPTARIEAIKDRDALDISRLIESIKGIEAPESSEYPSQMATNTVRLEREYHRDTETIRGDRHTSSTQTVQHFNIYAGGGNSAAAALMAQQVPEIPRGALGNDFEEILEGYIIPIALQRVGQRLLRQV